MLSKIKTTLRHSAIYSLGNITTKLIGIILLPLYTKHITVSEYGILGILEITIMILTQTLILGQSQAFLRFHDIAEYKDRIKSTLFTLFIFLFSVGVLINLLGQNLAAFLSSLFFKPTEFEVYFKLCFYIISLRIINSLFLSVLRAKEKSAFYAICNIIKMVIILGFNIYFVAFARIGVKGILYSYLIGDGLLFLILFPNIMSEMAPNFNRKILGSTINFGFPLILASLAGMLLNMGDRYILKLLVDYREVGLYNLGYKVAGSLNVFLIQSFSLSLLPISYKMYGQEGDKRYYSKMLTYFMFVLFFAGLGLALFSKEIIEILALNPDYWDAYRIVPFIILAYIFGGARQTVSIGLYLKRKTQYIAYNTVGAAVLNIILNFVLIPQYKMMGAALATLLAFIVLYFLSYYFSNKFYKVPYENVKLVKMLIVALGSFFLASLVLDVTYWLKIAIKLFILILFPFILYFMNFYERVEIDKIKEILKKIMKKSVRYSL